MRKHNNNNILPSLEHVYYRCLITPLHVLLLLQYNNNIMVTAPFATDYNNNVPRYFIIYYTIWYRASPGKLFTIVLYSTWFQTSSLPVIRVAPVFRPDVEKSNRLSEFSYEFSIRISPFRIWKFVTLWILDRRVIVIFNSELLFVLGLIIYKGFFMSSADILRR